MKLCFSIHITLKNTLYLLNIYWFVPFPREAVIWAFCLKCTFVTIGRNCSTFSPSPHFCLCHTSNLISFQDSNDKRLQSPECLWTRATSFIVVQDGEKQIQASMFGGKARKMIGRTAPHGFYFTLELKYRCLIPWWLSWQVDAFPSNIGRYTP